MEAYGALMAASKKGSKCFDSRLSVVVNQYFSEESVKTTYIKFNLMNLCSTRSPSIGPSTAFLLLSRVAFLLLSRVPGNHQISPKAGWDHPIKQTLNNLELHHTKSVACLTKLGEE